SANELLPVVRVGEIPSEDNPQRWLVEGLWGASSVGVVGGAPKCAKTWLGLDMALSVATGTACLGKYAVPEPGPVLVYLAEDALLVVRERVAGMARYRGLDLAQVEIHVSPRRRSGSIAVRTAHGSWRQPSGSGPGCSFSIPWWDFTASTRTTLAKWPSCWRTFARYSGSWTCRSCWCITRERMPRGESPPARDCAAPVTSTPSATRTSISGEPRNTWCSPASTARRPRRRRSIWIWSRPTRRQPTWRSSKSSRTASDAVSRSRSLTFWPKAWRSRERSSAIPWRSRTSDWARRWSRWSEPAGSAARPLVGSASADHPRGVVPVPPYAQLKGSWSSMKNGKPLFHHVLQCVSCWKKELPDGDRRQGRRDYTKCPGTRSRGTRAGDRCYPTASKVHRRQLVADARPDSAQKTGCQGHRFPIHRCTVGPRRHFDGRREALHASTRGVPPCGAGAHRAPGVGRVASNRRPAEQVHERS